MILNRINDSFPYGNITYTIGAKVFANEESEYYGLYGVITEIRYGEDQETDNDSPDIYCSFVPPILPAERKNLETRLSNLYQCEKHIDELDLDNTIMAPDMLHLIDAPVSSEELDIYLIYENWALEGDYGSSTEVTVCPYMAGFLFRNMIFQELLDGCISKWKDQNDFEVRAEPNCYEAWLHDEYYENHYKVSIECKHLPVTESLLAKLGKHYVDNNLLEDFSSHLQQSEDCAALSDSQLFALLSDPSLPERIAATLNANERYWDAYWDSITKCAEEVSEEYNTQESEESHEG